MLNKHKVFNELKAALPSLFLNNNQEIKWANFVWNKLCKDPELLASVIKSSSQSPLPTWSGELDQQIAIDPQERPYKVISVDGSQIYPDKHQGVPCYLLNIGSAEFEYRKNNAKATFDSIPSIGVIGQDNESYEMTPDIINCRRSELEFKVGLTKSQESSQNEIPLLFLCDGSLIFWHLENKDNAIKYRFLTSYLILLEQYYQHKILIAGYISLPKGKELVNLIRVALDNKLVIIQDAQDCKIEQIVDADISNFYLRPGTRSNIFANHSRITDHYPAHLKPHFFYMHVHNEIARIEIPAWIANNAQYVNRVAAIISDQCIKGYGYPVALAEAHEQAVVKNADRDFFFQMLYKLSLDNDYKFSMSQKSLKKRLVSI